MPDESLASATTPAPELPLPQRIALAALGATLLITAAVLAHQGRLEDVQDPLITAEPCSR